MLEFRASAKTKQNKTLLKEMTLQGLKTYHEIKLVTTVDVSGTE